MVGWYHQLNGHESGVGDGQRGLACCIPWDHKELDVTEMIDAIPTCDKAGVQSALLHNCNNKIRFVA